MMQALSLRHNSNTNGRALILIVSDILKNIQPMGNMLIEEGYEAATVQNGENALTFIETRLPDLILLDATSTKADGFEIGDDFKNNKLSNGIPIIYIIEHNSHKKQVFEAGGVDYLMLPFIEEELLVRINVHVDLQEAVKKLSEMSVTDEMTGVYNRRFAYRILNRQMEVTRREQHKFVLCLVEIDDLKQVNDTYGHEQGDFLIMTVINGLQEVIRLTDYIFRLGGNEFLLLLVHSDRKEADKVIARLRKKLNQQYIKDFSIDFSYGFSEFGSKEQIPADDLIKKAEAAMIADKKTRKADKQFLP